MYAIRSYYGVGVSACLLGNEVRFDGGHKRSRFITDELAGYFDFVSYCPEVAIGMGIPRQPIRLVGDPDNPQATGVRDPGLDVTQPLRAYGQVIAGKIDDLRGFIFKKDSPSCGMERVKLYNDKGMAERVAAGLFAQEIMAANPLLPVEEEGRLNDADVITSYSIHYTKLYESSNSRDSLLKRRISLIMAWKPGRKRLRRWVNSLFSEAPLYSMP